MAYKTFLEKFTWNKYKGTLGSDFAVKEQKNLQVSHPQTQAYSGLQSRRSWSLRIFLRVLALTLARFLCPLAQGQRCLGNICSESMYLGPILPVKIDFKNPVCQFTSHLVYIWDKDRYHPATCAQVFSGVWASDKMLVEHPLKGSIWPQELTTVGSG